VKTLTPPLTKGTVVLQCRKPGCEARLEANVSEGELRKGESDGPYVGEDYYAFLCPYCKSHLVATRSQVKWQR
jgi:hypothetical protein